MSSLADPTLALALSAANNDLSDWVGLGAADVTAESAISGAWATYAASSMDDVAVAAFYRTLSAALLAQIAGFDAALLPYRAVKTQADAMSVYADQLDPPGGPAPSIYIFEDDFAGIDGVVDPAKWVTSFLGAGSTITKSGQRMLMTNAAIASYGSTTRAVAIHTPIVHSQLRATVTIDPAKTEQYISFTLRGSGVWGSEEAPFHGYFFTIDTKHNKILIRKMVAGVYSDIDNIDFPVTAGTTYEVLAEAQGSALRFKMWDSSTPFTPTWDWTGVDTSITSAGVVMLANGGSLLAASSTAAFDTVRVLELAAPVIPPSTPPVDPGTGLTYTGPKLELTDVGIRIGLAGALSNQTLTTVGTRTGQHYTGSTTINASAAGSTFVDCQFDGFVLTRGDCVFNYCRFNGQLVGQECNVDMTRCGLLHGATDGYDYFRNTSATALMNATMRECVYQQNGDAYLSTDHGDTFQSVGPTSITAVGCVYDMLITPTWNSSGVLISGPGRTSAFNTQPASNVAYESGPVRTYDCWTRGGSRCVYAKTYDPATAAGVIIHTRMKLEADGGLYVYRSTAYPGPTMVSPTTWSGASLAGI